MLLTVLLTLFRNVFVFVNEFLKNVFYRDRIYSVVKPNYLNLHSIFL